LDFFGVSVMVVFKGQQMCILSLSKNEILF